ncbi:MAG: fibronectin type III domain-containing protein, partial [Candidatus Poribacteria bacterium]|nr:fibronectin type III domain-containing protein [Candidatus Poribacteria bacterium]
SGHSNTVTAGTVHQAEVTSTAPIYGARLYVNSTTISWFGGSSAKTTKSLNLTYTFPSDASGSYTIMARVYPWDGDTYGNYTDYSYTVTIGSSDSTTTPTSTPSTPSTPTYHACGIHESTVSGDHSWITPSCGVSAHAGYACQVSSDHKFPVTCPHNSNGQSCIYSTYYPCSPHTHAYPSAPREPRTPTSLSAAIGSTSGSIDLSWTAPADGGSPITGYQITYCKYDNGWKRENWTSWSSTGSTSTSYTVTGLEVGGFYRFRVRAVNSIGSSRVSRVAQKIVQ